MRKIVAFLVAILLCVSAFAPAAVFAATEEYVKTNKTEYYEDEIFILSYKFSQVASDNKRYINIYNSSTTFDDSTWLFAVNGNKTSYSVASEWLTWSPNPSKIGKAGTYTVKVVNKDTHTPYTGYENMTYTFTVKARTEGTTPTAPVLSVANATVAIGDSLTIAYDGMSMTALNYDDMYSVSLNKADGTEITRWYLWDCGSTYKGLYGTIEHTDTLVEGQYNIKLETAFRDTPDTRTVKQTIPVTVTGSAVVPPVESAIKTDKTEYWEGELFIVSYEFDNEVDSSLPKSQQRAINIYKGDTLVYVNVANKVSASTANEWLWCANESLAGTPGTYTMKVEYRDSTTGFPGYENESYTFIVKARTQGTTPGTPTISVEDDSLNVGDSLKIKFDGMSMAALGVDYVYQVHLRKADGTLIKTWTLWDCGTTYMGLFGTLEYTEGLSAGSYKVELGTLKNDSTQETAVKISVPVTVGQAGNTSTGDAELMFIAFLLIAGCGAYMLIKKRQYQ